VKKLLILTGPQGAGNHLFAKCFIHSSLIGGWQELTSKYWAGHHTEHFFPVWSGARALSLTDFKDYDYWVTSISVPYIDNNKEQIPDVVNFVKQATELGIDIQIGIITRDKNILELQQSRVRGKSTLDKFMSVLNSIDQAKLSYHFLSHESLVLHELRYVNYLNKLFNFPTISKYELNSNANKKYIKYVDKYWLDDEVKKACTASKSKK
jgi:hypothetical protein